MAPGSASSVEEVGAVLSIRICVPAVLIPSEFETRSTEKYLIVYVPSDVRLTDVPWAELVVGFDPSVV